MISHRITLFTPPAPKEPVYDGRGHRNANLSGIMTQLALDNFLMQKPYVGAFVIMGNISLVNVYQLNYILDVQNVFQNLTFTGFGKAETHLVLQVREKYNENEVPYIRWLDIEPWRIATEEERKAFVNDNVQNYIQQVVSKREKALQEIRHSCE